MKKIIPYSRQVIDEEDIKSVVKVLKSEYLTQGEIGFNFEEALSKYCGSKFAITTNSASTSLQLICQSIGLKKGDIVWTSVNTFTASATCALHLGAKIDFIDIDFDNFNLSIELLRIKLEFSKKNNTLPLAIIVVHLAGNPCNLKSIYELSKIYKFLIIEDASHALGSKFRNYRIGQCKYSIATIFSFHPVKPITTGEGGAVLTNNKNIYQKIKILRSHGIHKEKKKFLNKNNGNINYYEQIELGYNFRLNDLSAALGISQLKKIDSFTNKRNILAQNYINYLKNTDLRFQKINSNDISSYHLFILNFKNYGKKYRDIVYKNLHEKGYYCNIHYIPLVNHPFYKKLGFQKNKFKYAQLYYKNCLSIPLYPSLSEINQNKVIEVIKSSIQ